MKRREWSFCAMLLGLALSGCGAEPGPESSWLSTDSMGIEIVVNNTPLLDGSSQWRLSDEPVRQIGSAEGDDSQLLFRVSGSRVLPDGRIVLVNGGTEVRFYGRSGEFVESVGRRGEGPGEFQAVMLLDYLPGDTLVTYDLFLQRVTSFTWDGSGPTTMTLKAWRERSTPLPIARLADGSFLARAAVNAMYVEDGFGVKRDPTWLTRHDPDGTAVGTVLEWSGPEHMVLNVNGILSTSTAPFGRRAIVGLAGEHLVYAYAEQTELRFYGLDGLLRRVARRDEELVPVTSSEIDDYKSRYRESRAGRAGLEDLIAALEFPPTYPTFSDLETDAAGNVWVENYRKGGDESEIRWSVFAGNGRWITDVVVPDRYSIHWIGEDLMSGVWRDSLDIEYLQVFQIHKQD